MIRQLSLASAICAVLAGPALAASPPSVTAGGVSNEVCTPATGTGAATVTAGAYSAGNQVGPLIALTNALIQPPLTAILQSITLNFLSVQTAEFDVTPFSSQPTATTWTDKTTPSIATGDKFKARGTIKLTNNFSGLGTHTTYSADAIARVIETSAPTTYFIITTAGTPTFASTGDMQFCASYMLD